MKILITGGAGYIGSTVGSACEEAGHEVVVLDDLSAGRREFVRDRTFYQGDIADQDLLDREPDRRRRALRGQDHRPGVG